VRLLLGEIPPLSEIESLEGSICPIEHNLSPSLKKEREGSLCRANIYRLPQAVQHQHMLTQTHAECEFRGKIA
jgi:hypothetical protein